MIINSAVIEIDEDKFWISYGFQGCQLLIFIAEKLQFIVPTTDQGYLKYF
jgi:hypothetical protein